MFTEIEKTQERKQIYMGKKQEFFLGLVKSEMSMSNSSRNTEEAIQCHVGLKREVRDAGTE